MESGTRLDQKEMMCLIPFLLYMPVMRKRKCFLSLMNYMKVSLKK